MADLVLRQVVAVIDGRTTVICLHAAGQIRKMSEPFDTLLGPQDETPFHVHCRSIIVPYMSGFVTDIRARANAELMRRPLKQRRIGPNGETGPLPPKATPPPTTGPRLPAGPVKISDDEYGTRHDQWTGKASTDVDYTDGWKKGYTSVAVRMNEWLRGEYKPTDPREISLMKSLIRRFGAFFGRQAERMPVDTILWRGVRATDTFDPLKLMKQGKPWHDDGWFSASTSKGKAGEFGQKGGGGRDWMLVVTVPKGAKFVYGKAVQREIVLGKGSTFDVTDVDSKKRIVYLTLRTGKTR